MGGGFLVGTPPGRKLCSVGDNFITDREISKLL